VTTRPQRPAAVSGRRDSAPGLVMVGQFIDHDARVFDEHRVWKPRVGREATDLDAQSLERALVLGMLGRGAPDIDESRARGG